jgi:hypothetical protein
MVREGVLYVCGCRRRAVPTGNLLRVHAGDLGTKFENALIEATPLGGQIMDRFDD